MSMRFLNMHDLSYVRRTHLAKQTCIGKGSFASVFAASADSPTVSKVTTDQYSYYWLADGVWQVMRGHVEQFFPRLVEDHGDVGESRGLTAYLVEVERLFPIASTEHRRLISRWCDEYSAHQHESYIRQPAERMRQASVNFCDRKANQKDAPYREVFEAMYQFLLNYGGALDLKPSNFMCRADGTLVWNDVVFDAATFGRPSGPRLQYA